MNKVFRIVSCLIMVFLFCTSTDEVYASRGFGGYYSKERITSLRKNCQKYDWAQNILLAAVEKAKPWVIKSDEILWKMVPGQDLPRTIDVTYERFNPVAKFSGCLVCGNKILKYGNYPYEPDFEKKPWKLTCPSCHSVFPTNDFSKYYESGLDKHGLFHPANGDTTLLFNTAHPDPKDPLHKFGVDDGFGYKADNGRTYKYVGYYSWKYWRHIVDGLVVLSDAFLYTGDIKYAHKAAILLDRIADVYPSMDWKPYAVLGWYHSDGNGGKGKIEGSIWETSLVQDLANAYDKIISGTQQDAALYKFLKKQSERYELPSSKGTRKLFLDNVDNGILKTAFEAVNSGSIRGNQGMYQLTVATCALALNTQPETNEWLDWLFSSSGGAISSLMVNHFDHDGTSDEGAPSYSLIWGGQIAKLADLLINYPTYKKFNILRDFPQFKAAFTVAYRMAALGKAIPNSGDNGATGVVSNRLASPEFMAKGYLFTKDSAIAIAAYRANGNSAKGLGLDIYSSDPEAANRQIRQFGEKAGPRPVGGYLMSGFGLALLENKMGSSGIALAGSYGRTQMHGHRDLLNFDLFAFNNWLAPDLGYPEFATNVPNRTEWNGSTISHNTVYVNGEPQVQTWGGHSKLFSQLKDFGVFKLDGKSAYPGLDEYTRTMFLVGGSEDVSADSNAYVVDIFRVKGGYDHVYSFHGPPGTISTKGLSLKEQKGTYAGEDIAKGTPAKGFPVGYSFLYNIRKDEHPPTTFILDWKAETGYRGLTKGDDIHLRMHALTPVNDVVLAEGAPPSNKPGNPESLGYVLMHRTGTDLNSTFVSVFEPYRKNPFILSVERLNNNQEDQVLLKVNKVNGYVDYLLYNPLSSEVIRLPNGIFMEGDIGFLKVKEERVEKGILINGTSLKKGNMHLESSGVYTGKIVDMDKRRGGEGWLLVDSKLPLENNLIGRQIIVNTKGERDASYPILDLKREGKYTRIFCGPISFVSGFTKEEKGKSNADLIQVEEEHYLYTIEKGATFRIASQEIYKRPE